MLNLSFSKTLANLDTSTYVLPDELATIVARQNTLTATGSEFRLQSVYGDEVWNTLRRLSLDTFDWKTGKILDICCGTGFLSYHLLRKATPENLTFLDISWNEVSEARKLLSRPEYPPYGFVSDATQVSTVENHFDMIIGNSFLHHFYDLPKTLHQIFACLKPGGIFVSLHEPTLCAVPLEAGNLKLWLKCLLKGSVALEPYRYAGPEPLRANDGADVWIFEPSSLRNVLIEAGFDTAIIKPQRMARSLLVAKFRLHLSENKKRLSPIEARILSSAISIDNGCAHFLPDPFFGSLCLAARKRGG